jgi:hypothetical protein
MFAPVRNQISAIVDVNLRPVVCVEEIVRVDVYDSIAPNGGEVRATVGNNPARQAWAINCAGGARCITLHAAVRERPERAPLRPELDPCFENKLKAG